jgi:hypothetical protein
MSGEDAENFIQGWFKDGRRRRKNYRTPSKIPDATIARK